MIKAIPQEHIKNTLTDENYLESFVSNHCFTSIFGNCIDNPLELYPQDKKYRRTIIKKYQPDENYNEDIGIIYYAKQIHRFKRTIVILYNPYCLLISCEHGLNQLVEDINNIFNVSNLENDIHYIVYRDRKRQEDT